ncbi:MAG: acyl-CoA dehydratase activase [Deltaproteobacteria bacterium]|nr:acyl-CoA dehydratase activase [Deltaproteobacteria bacterium]
MTKAEQNIILGLDVGSTTVKVVVMDSAGKEILWKGYKRHETRQPETLLTFLQSVHEQFTIERGKVKAFITGSGGAAIAPFIGARFVQEVNAISLAVERLYPETSSVIEVGGQDSKIILWIVDEKTGNRVKVPTMNDKCAGGTGAVIDKIGAKLGFSQEDIQNLKTDSSKIHQVAARCGVFAETDINSLQKQGVPSGELMNSLFEAIVQQNLSVLTRGNVLMPNVLLLGGPHTYIPALTDAWRRNIPKVWEEREVTLPEGVDAADLITVPEDSQFFAAIGAIIFGLGEEGKTGVYEGCHRLAEHVENGKISPAASGADAFFKNEEERDRFIADYAVSPFTSKTFKPGEKVKGYIGIDGGSTSTKGVVIDEKGDILAKAYRLSAGNPLEDTKWVVSELKKAIEASGADFEVGGVGTTGYAKDMLKEAIQADRAIVETVAHTRSSLKYFNDVDVICDVGGQDIKVILLKDGRVTDFKLNTQCSAGNGYFLQSTARQFGYDVSDYAEAAFSAGKIPAFNYGCAVFLESDIVNFQQMGWRREDIMAGLAHVLPRNIWLYVVQEPNLKKLGRKFVLQGGTQKNLAAVKAQNDYIKSKVPDAHIFVHPHTGESGAMGAALEAIGTDKSSFIGFQALEELTLAAIRDETTRCFFCKNNCMRTFIDISSQEGASRRYIIAPCEKGDVEDKEAMLKIKKGLDAVKHDNPDLSMENADMAFKKKLMERKAAPSLFANKAMVKRQKLRIGIPKALNIFSTAPFLIAYLESVGVNPKNILFSDFTNEDMFKEGSRRGSIDQCFPSKVSLAHVHNLVYKKKVDVVFFPILINLPSPLVNTVGSCTCPTVQATPEVCRAAFLREKDTFAELNVQYIYPVLNLGERELLEQQMLDCFKPLLKISRRENKKGVNDGLKALDSYYAHQRELGSTVIKMLEDEKRVGLVLLGRPYHSDPGLNHGILEEIQKRGYPVLTIDSLPTDDEMLDRLFGEEVRRGDITSPMDISDVWKNSFSENSSKKLWGAKYVARHPNLASLDLSNFKCGHDSPIYSVVEDILHSSGTPYFTFHDIDENKPSGSIKIRVETIDYFLDKYEEALGKREALEKELEERVRAYEEILMAECGKQ